MKRPIAFSLAATLLMALPAAAKCGVKATIDLLASLSSPTFLCHNPADNKVYCSLTGAGEEGVAVIDANLETYLTKVNTGGMAPGELLYAQASGRVFVHDNATTLWAINGSSNAIDTMVMAGQGEAELAYNHLNDKIYCADWFLQGLSIFNSNTMALMGNIPEIQGNLLFVESAQRLYGVSPALSQIKVVDGASDAVVDSIMGVPVTASSQMEYNSFNQKLYVSVPGQEDVFIINTVTNTVDTVIQIGISITGLAYCPLNNSVYVTTAGIAKAGRQKSPSPLYELAWDNAVNVYGIDDAMQDIVYNPADSLLYLLCTETPTKMMWLFDPAQQAVAEGVDLMGSGAYRDLAIDNQGEVYTCDLWQGMVYVVGRVPNTMWRSNPAVNPGNWFDGLAWEVYADSVTGWVQNTNDAVYPTAADSTILVQAGDTMQVMFQTLAVDQLTVDGTLNHFESVLTVNDGPGVDITVNGVFNQQTMTAYEQMPGSQWAYGPGALHDYWGDGDSIPIAVWDSNSEFTVHGFAGATSFRGGIGQQFGIINWDGGSSFGFTVATEPGFTARRLNVYSTGGVAPLTICSDPVPEVNLGWLVIYAGSDVLLGSGGVKKLNIDGNLDMFNSPPLGLYDPSNPGICSLRVRGDYTYMVAKGGKGLNGPSGPDSAAVVFDGGGGHNILTAGDMVSGFVDFIVEPGNIISIDQAFALGNGSQGRFWLMPGAFLATAHSLGAWVSADSGCIRNLGPRIYGPGAGFIFPDTTQPGIAGDAVAGDVSMIWAGNPYGIGLLSSVTIADSLVLQGELTTGTDTVFLLSGAAVSAIGGYVQGNLAKEFQVGSDYKDFEVGTPGGQYSPAGIQLFNSTLPGYVTVAAMSGPHPMADSLDQCLQRHWRISGPGIGFDNSEVTLSYLPVDFSSAFFESLHESTMVAGRYGNGALPGWTLPAVLSRTYNGPADGGSITLAGGVSFDDNPEFTTGRDAASIHTFLDTIPPTAPESLQIYGFNPSYWLNGLTASVPVGWINPYDSTGIARAFYKTYAPPSGPLDFTDSIMVVGGARDTFWLAVDTLNGNMPVHLWLRDGAGNASHLNTGSVIARRDTVPPAGATVIPFGADTTYAASFQVNWSPGSDTPSGIQAWRVLSRIDTSAAWDTLAPFTNDTTALFSGALAGHRYYFEAAACDSAYNWEPLTGISEDSVFVSAAADTTPPGPPSGLLVNGADPMPWTNADSLSLTWADPEPGITAGYYKIGSAPTGNFDTTGQLATLGGSATIAYPGAGPAPIFLWLADSAGNTLYLNSGSAAVRADKTPPFNVAVSVFSPDTVFNTTFTVSWSSGSDTISGIRHYQLRYSVDSPSVWTTWVDSLAATSVGFTGNVGHRYYFEANGTDSAGNAEPFLGTSEASVYVGALDTVRPYVVSASPSNGQANVDVGQPVIVTFSEPVDTASLRFTCAPDPGAWTQAWSGAQTVTLGHYPLAQNTTHTFRIDSIADPAGNAIDTSAAPNQAWSFTTVGPTTMVTNWGGGVWRLWSAPMMPQDTSALAILGDDLGAYSDTTWRFLGYKQGAGYLELPSVYPGYGYWLATAQSASIDVQGAPLTGIQAVALDSGWNMVGDPFDSSASLSGLRVRWNDGVPHELPFGDSLVNSVLRQRLYQYLDNSADMVNNGYWDTLDPASAADSIRPWQGYAAYAARPCSLVVERGFKGGEVDGRPERQIIWQLELSAYMGPWADRGLRVGISPQASAAYDRLDAEKPPLVTDQLSMQLPHYDWNQGPCRSYMRDFRPPGFEQQWTIKVDAAERLPVGVDFALEGRLEPDYHLYIVNRRLGQAQEVSGSGRVDLDGGGELAVVYTSRGLVELDLKPLEFGLTRIHPNPFRGRAVIDYQLERPGRVSLKVYNSLGQLAAVLVDGHQEAGFHAAVWDGTRAAAGVYLVRLESGGRTRVTKTVKLR